MGTCCWREVLCCAVGLSIGGAQWLFHQLKVWSRDMTEYLNLRLFSLSCSQWPVCTSWLNSLVFFFIFKFLFYYFIFIYFLLLFSYSCLHFLPSPPPHLSQTHLPPLLAPSPLVLSLFRSYKSFTFYWLNSLWCPDHICVLCKPHASFCAIFPVILFLHFPFFKHSSYLWVF